MTFGVSNATAALKIYQPDYGTHHGNIWQGYHIWQGLVLAQSCGLEIATEVELKTLRCKQMQTATSLSPENPNTLFDIPPSLTYHLFWVVAFTSHQEDDTYDADGASYRLAVVRGHQGSRSKSGTHTAWQRCSILAWNPNKKTPKAVNDVWHLFKLWSIRS